MSNRYGQDPRDDRRRPRDEFEDGGSSQASRNVYPRGNNQQSPPDRWQRAPNGPSQGGRDFGGGGRGQGGPGGGRGGGGFQGGRGPKKLHMGEIAEIIQLVKNSRNCSDSVMMDVVIEPTEADQARDELVASSGDLFMPKQSVWREKITAGVALDNDSHQVFANHYLVDASPLPSEVYHYNVAIFSYDRAGELRPDDLSKEGKEQRVNVALLKKLLEQNKRAWLADGSVGVSYDGGSTLITSKPLPLGPENRTAEKVEHPEDIKSSFSVAIMFVKALPLPDKLRDKTGEVILPGTSWNNSYHPTVQALDVALLAFARWQSGDTTPQWLLTGAKVFKVGGVEFPLNEAFKAMLGYYASLKVCKSGLLMVSDISVTCFMKGGPLIEVIAALAGYRNVGDMVRDSKDQERIPGNNNGLDKTKLTRVEDMLKGCRIKLTHLGRNKKFKKFESAASKSTFDLEGGEKVSVAEYYARMVQEGDPRYGKHLSRWNGLQYPSFPTVNVGTKKRATLIPIELIEVPPGQTRQKAVDKDVAGKIIKHAAMLPNDRMQYLSSLDSTSLMGTVKSDANSKGFGLNKIDNKPARLQSTILCPVKLQYANRLIEPMLTGTWNLAGNVAFARPAPGKDSKVGGYNYDVIIVHGGSPRAEAQVVDFAKKLEAESKIVNIPLVRMSNGAQLVQNRREDLIAAFDQCKYNGANIVLVVLLQDGFYKDVKFAADTVNMVTQCIKITTIERAPRGVTTNVLQKINLKMGGVNQTLAARGQAPNTKPVFQTPPRSISWIFNEPCMVVGVDVNHPEIGQTGESVAAVVASMDGMLGQYACYVSTCEKGVEPVATLETAMHSLLKAFAVRNQGQYPRRVIFYRDGVADNQFNEILDKEISAFKNAVMLCGLVEESLKISIVVVQKKHHTRLVYQQNGRGEFMNPCVGLCVDSTEGVSNSGANLISISSPVINEFYLNSHLAVLGTSKPAKYSLIYDEIGFKNAELQLLTYWTTHLYGRCTRGVSYATPAYYAHWAARRGKVLLAAGASSNELRKCTEQWLDPQNPNNHSTMYFI